MGRGRDKTHYTKNCAWCGNSFETTRSNALYCNEDKGCLMSAFYFRKHPYETRKCLGCGKEFQTRHKAQKYCHTNCGERYRNRMAKEKRNERKK